MEVVQKICCVLVEPKGYEREGALKYKKKLFSMLKENGVLGRDLEVDVKPLDKGCKEFYFYTSYSYFEFLTTPHVLEAMIQAEKEGYSAATVACYFDPAIEEAQAIMKIPVIGIGEASMLLARMLSSGRGTAIITMSYRGVTKIHDLIDKYKFKPFMISKDPVRKVSQDLYIKASTSSFSEDVKALKEAYVEVAEKCVSDGAEVIITGCGGLGPLLAVEGLREIESVPVIDPITAAIMLARTLIDLEKIGLVFSKRLMYPPNEEDWKKGRESFGLTP